MERQARWMTLRAVGRSGAVIADPPSASSEHGAVRGPAR
jgi:hypothetical protein